MNTNTVVSHLLLSVLPMNAIFGTLTPISFRQTMYGGSASMTPDNKHERQWYEAQKAKVKAAREGATLIYTEGDESIGVMRGYYVFWMERETPYHDSAYVHQYVGK